ncbi:arylsulfatase [Sphingobium faniae]|nr:arylsulfatase [Sphingobium faniae]
MTIKASRYISLLALAAAAPAQAGNVLPLPEPGFQGKVGRTFRESDPPAPPPPVQAPKGAPNIVVIMLDDAGFGQYATFGGAIPSPALDELAKDGLRYNRFHTAGICSPTRAALLTGRNPHNAGVGIVTELSNGYDGYTGIISRATTPFARILRDHGYATAMFGKNHNTPTPQAGAGGPYDHWPNAFGFDYFYGFNAWGTSQYQPLLFENNQPLPPSTDPDYHLTSDLADHAIGWIKQVRSVHPGQPYLAYIAIGAVHAPHHAPKEWIDRFKGRFDKGWDAYRQEVFARQKTLGVIPADAELTPRPAELPAWDSLTPDQKRIAARQMEVFAGFAAHADAQIKRVVDAVRAMPDGDNTLIIYIAGDNGASAEGAQTGTLSELAPSEGLEERARPTLESLQDLGGPRYNNNYPAGWAWAVNTPFRYYKQVVSHLGAIRNPMVIAWPKGIDHKGEVRTQYADVTDIAPTLLAAAGLTAPGSVDGVAQKPMDGVSLLPTFRDARAPEVRSRQYFEVFGNRAIYDKGWMASAKLSDPWNPNRAQLDPGKAKWELYDLDHDFTQSRDLAAKYPARLEALKQLWWGEAARNNVLPLDWRAGERLATLGRPAAQNHYTLYPGTVGIAEAIAPSTHNRSWTITAHGRFRPEDKGVLITQGGMTGGWAMRMAGGRLLFDYNLQAVDHHRITSDQPVPAGAKTLSVRFAYAGAAGERGKGGTVTLLADGQQIGNGALPQTTAAVFSLNEGLDVGADYGSPVADYALPAPFTGTLDKVDIDLN